MNINHIRYFEEVCKTGSVTKAANECYISQPSITSAINSLEKELGYKLFYRVNNRLQLTPAGTQFRLLAKTFLTDYDNFEKKAYDISATHTSIIKLGIPSVIGSFLINKIIPGFHDQYPETDLHILEIGTIDGINMLVNADLDLMIGINRESYYSNCDFKVISTTELQLAVNTEHPLVKEKVITPDMLAGKPFVLLSKGSYHYQELSNYLHDVDHNIILRSNQISTIENLITENKALTITYKELFSHNEHIKFIPLSDPICVNIGIFKQKNSYCSKSVQALINYISKNCSLSSTD